MNRRSFIAGMGLYGLLSSTSSMAKLQGELPEKGIHLKYVVYFGDNKIGHQNINIRKHSKKDQIKITYQIQLEVRILFAVAYSLEHDSTEVWDINRKLQSIHSKTIENGQATLVEGQLKQNHFVIKNNTGEIKAPKDIITSDSFWVIAALTSHSVMNARTGDLAKPKVIQQGKDHYHLKADFTHSPVEAHLYFKNDLLEKAEVDSDGHVVRFIRVMS